MSEFDWSKLSEASVRAFAELNADGRTVSSKKKASALLHASVGLPGPDFFKDPEVRRVAAGVWLADDEDALNRVYGRLLHLGIPKANTRRTKLRAVQARILPGGPPVTGPVRDALTVALLAAGGITAALGERQALGRLNEIPTVGDRVRLHPYQETVTAKLRSAYRARGRRMVGVVVMPTGSGKTVTAVNWLLDDHVRRGRKILWVTHRKELLEQTARCFVRCAPVLAGARTSFAMRLISQDYSPVATITDSHHDVVVATIGSLSSDPKAVESFLNANDCIVVFDEAHHCVAPTWRRVLQHAREKSGDAVLGLTATPTRTSEVERSVLAKLLERPIAEVAMSNLVAGNYLAEARCESEPTHVPVERRFANSADLAHIRRFGELSPRLAAALADWAPRNKAIVLRYLNGPKDGKQASYGKTIVFAVTIDHARELARAFARAGVPAGALTSTGSSRFTPAPRLKEAEVDRTELLEEFATGDLPVLVNVAVLTEGVDVPNVETVFLARPTGSEVLMSQMVGRALRGKRVGGTAHAYLVSFRDHWDQFDHWMDPIRLPGLTGIEPEVTSKRTGKHTWITVDEAHWQALVAAATAEAEEKIPVTIGNGWSRLPVGLYRFEAEVPVEARHQSSEIDTRSVDLWVYEHDQAGFTALSQAVEAGRASTKPEEWLATHFLGTPSPKPSLERLERLAAFIRTEGRMPEFLALQGRERVDPELVATAMHKLSDIRARRAHLDAVIDANSTLVTIAYGGESEFRRLVADILNRKDYGIPDDFAEIRIPRVGPGRKTDYTYGTGAHDLNAILKLVMSDRTLFPTPLPRVSGGIQWMNQPTGSAWALYDYAPGRGQAVRGEIFVNPWLDSTIVPAFVIEFLVYHELLHHQDVTVLNDPDSYHDRDFRDREALHPKRVEANAFIDTMHDHWRPQDHTTQQTSKRRPTTAPRRAPAA